MTTIGLICAIPQESTPIVRRFPRAAKHSLSCFHAWTFTAGNNPVTLVESGMGPANAEAATAALIHSVRPDLVLNAGFCGALRPGISIGDLVLARQQYSLSTGTLSPGTPPDSTLTDIISHELKPAGCLPGTFITTAAFTSKRSVAMLLTDTIINPVLEMESAAIIRRCHHFRIRVAALRAVSDPGDEDPTALVTALFNQDFTLNRIRCAATLLGKPWMLPQLIRLAGNAHKAGNSLADALAPILERL